MFNLPKSMLLNRLVFLSVLIISITLLLITDNGCIDDSTLTLPSSQEIPPLHDIPADLDSVIFTVTGAPTIHYIMLELSQSGGFNGFVIVNGEGKPVWYFRTTGGASGFTRRANGDFVFLDGSGGLTEVSIDHETVHTLPQEAAPGRHIHHDVATTPNNTILFIADDWQLWNDTLTNGASLWEWNPETGSTTKRWSAFDYLNPVLDRGTRSTVTDWLHPNSISYGRNGNIILSLHFLDQVISIAPDFQSIEWRLGGIRATIAVADSFSGQHCVSEVAPNDILMFDNGYERTTEKYSRALELGIEGNRTRTLWQWRPQTDNWSRIISSARRISNGNTLVGFGYPKNQAIGSTGPIEVFEVTSSGKSVWQMTVSGAIQSMYRATPIEVL